MIYTLAASIRSLSPYPDTLLDGGDSATEGWALEDQASPGGARVRLCGGSVERGRVRVVPVRRRGRKGRHGNGSDRVWWPGIWEEETKEMQETEHFGTVVRCVVQQVEKSQAGDFEID